jgi:hypothetical protein
MYVYGYMDLDNVQVESPFIKFIIFKNRHGWDFKILNTSAKAAINILLTKLNRTGFMWANKNCKKWRKHVTAQAEAKRKKD